MISEDFAIADWRRLATSPGLAELLDGKCDHCGHSYHAPPCIASDHYRTSIDLAISADEKPWISFACQRPTEQQAPILPSDQGRRHPHNGRRPEWSGYCTVGGCACHCHRDEAIDTDDIEEVA